MFGFINFVSSLCFSCFEDFQEEGSVPLSSELERYNLSKLKLQIGSNQSLCDVMARIEKVAEKNNPNYLFSTDGAHVLNKSFLYKKLLAKLHPDRYKKQEEFAKQLFQIIQHIKSRDADLKKKRPL